jgi:predicted RNA-binding protein YlxR (DUF448 family)
VAKKTQKRMKHIPQRTCIGCRTVLGKRELIRIVQTPQGILVDPSGRANGRGAYIHNIRSCWEQAIKGPINHALRVELTSEDKVKLLEFMQTIPEGESSTTETEKSATLNAKPIKDGSA